MVETHEEFVEELQKIREKTTNEPTHFIIWLPHWDAMVRDFANKTDLHTIDINSMYMGLNPIIIGLKDIPSCSECVQETLERGGVVFLRIPYPKGMME